MLLRQIDFFTKRTVTRKRKSHTKVRAPFSHLGGFFPLQYGMQLKIKNSVSRFDLRTVTSIKKNYNYK